MQNIDTTIAQQAIFAPPPLACPFPLQLKGQGAKLAMACQHAEKLQKKMFPDQSCMMYGYMDACMLVSTYVRMSVCLCVSVSGSVGM